MLGVVQAWHRRNGWEVLALQQWEGTVGAECPRHHAGKQKGIAIFFKIFHILDVQVTRVAWAVLCSASALQVGTRELLWLQSTSLPLLISAKACLSVGRSLPKALLCESVSLLILER